MVQRPLSARFERQFARPWSRTKSVPASRSGTRSAGKRKTRQRKEGGKFRIRAISHHLHLVHDRLLFPFEPDDGLGMSACKSC
jgi:hypothetical protein